MIININIGVDIRESRLGARRSVSVDRTFQEIQPVIEFMISESCRIIAHRIEGSNHRVSLSGVLRSRERVDLGFICTERRSLNQVSVIEQQVIGFLCPCCLNQCVSPGKSDRRRRCILKIIPAINVGVHVRCAH
ncbi:hypothetical protein D3C75_377970 [compost metagenome]